MASLGLIFEADGGITFNGGGTMLCRLTEAKKDRQITALFALSEDARGNATCDGVLSIWTRPIEVYEFMRNLEFWYAYHAGRNT